MSAHINTFHLLHSCIPGWTYLRFLPRKPGPMPYPCCLVQPDQMPSADLCSASTPRKDIFHLPVLAGTRTRKSLRIKHFTVTIYFLSINLNCWRTLLKI